MPKQNQPFGLPIIFWIHQIAQASRREMLAGFKEQGINLTPEQWSLLVELWKSERLSPSKLAERTGRDRPSTSRLIESLNKQGLVQRQYSSEDRRAYQVTLTEAGRDCHAKLLPIYNDIIKQTVKGFTQAQQKELSENLKQLYFNIPCSE